MATWQPSWWNETHLSTWERVKEALHRDWEQTKHDVGMKSGHHLKQGVTDTIKQAAGSEPLPPSDQPNPAKVIGNWDEVEMPVGYGYMARERHGVTPPVWNDQVEEELRQEWEGGPVRPDKPWAEVKQHVRRGYEYTNKA